MSVPLSLIDFATIFEGERPGDSFKRSVAMAQKAEALGFKRIWYAEHHNMPTISSSAPAVLISHIGAHTNTIRLGAGGVMLPNHSPYVIAEQFGTLAELYPDRIDLGLGRAPGTDMNTLRALRREPSSAEYFPQDVVELQSYLAGRSRLPGVEAIPGKGTNVPLYILGSSLFGAQLAAQLGMPYSFASHFAPAHLEQAVSTYRENYQPSEQHPEPYVIAAVNVTAADSTDVAHEHFATVARARVRSMAARGRATITDEQLDAIMDSPSGRQIVDMLRYTAIGTGTEVRDFLEDFTRTAQADELMISLQSPGTEATSRSMEILAEAWFRA
ncbi:luciferase family oxidoreductase, FMN-dependent, PP_0088 family [Corynebacterium efficiens YS-314]|uniref:Luciferase-like domain-containing protein n=1 Tax=Corynebacterium efficiens (strain DSM 44549 / YS-314 / AJ 12310 / JCM 11189 / NBRC 100395) TaxID=196164 RepID=Q8FND1_COREF|nr:LLM class flavin-dependent oxidoreductase [Corynebacterium efficiens]EEW49178.1 luciferase family oxidoreductase, FMN-dependent, PP_0088 family [Corynebacterium efficiens YS-314]BAC19023.1 conserved hypothetical protein [Corynebacterium efficiens YS-314]